MDRALPRNVLIGAVLVAASFAAPATPAFAVNGVPVCTVSNDQTRPVVVADGAGGVIIAWHDERPATPGGGVVFAQRLNGGGAPQWTVNGVALSTTGDPELPGIAPDGAGGAFVAYGGNVQPRIQRVNSAGVRQWGLDGTQLSSSASTKRDLAVAADIGGSGGAIVVWREDNATGGFSDIYAQKVNSAGVIQWSAGGVPVTATNMFNENLPTLVSDGSGGAFVAWGGGGGARVQRLNAAGATQWGNVNLSAMINNNRPTVISDGSGGALIVWAGGGVYAQRVDGTGNKQWNPANAGVQLSTVGLVPSVIPDGAGGATVTWQDFRSGTNYDIYAQGISSSGATKWGMNGVGVCTATANQESPVIVADGGTGAIISWSDTRSGMTAYDIYAQRIDVDGDPLWTLDGVPACNVTGNQEFPAIATDGAGGAFIAWQDRRSGTNYDIYAQRMNGAGGVTLAVPTDTELSGLVRSWPNPFSERVQMAFSLTVETRVHMEVFGVDGRVVRSFESALLTPGPQVLTWDGLTSEGRPAREGLYFLRASGRGVELTRSVVRLK